MDSFVLPLSWKAVSDKPQNGRTYYESLHKNGSTTPCTFPLYATKGLNWVCFCKPKNLNLQKKNLEPGYWVSWFQILDPSSWAYHKTRKPEILIFLCVLKKSEVQNSRLDLHVVVCWLQEKLNLFLAITSWEFSLHQLPFYIK